MKIVISMCFALLAIITIIVIHPIINDFFGIVEYVKKHPKALDEIAIAVQIGRLDYISGLLTILGLLLAIFAFFGFGYIKHAAEDIAERTAKDIAEDIAKTVAEVKINEYIQDEMPDLMKEYSGYMVSTMSGDIADLISENSGGNGDDN
ncbi:hypothetical protein [Kiloniella sp.]|uniref:hypothetical protein n=1 Tax=Kiloniella sp. TaxID=1938587 RepID=UPI003A907093